VINQSLPPPPRSDLPRKLTLLFLLTTAAAFGIIFLFRAGHPMAILNLLILDSALLGLTAGFGARLILKRRRVGLRLLAALAALTVGLLVLGLFTGWKYGLGPLTFRPGRFDWAGLVQLVIGGLAIVLSMFAWRRPAPVISPVAEPSIQPAAGGEASELQPQPEKAKPPKPDSAARVAEKTAKKSQGSNGSKPRGRARVRDAAKTGGKKAHPISAVIGPRRKSRKPEVQFTASEEHRCPYCLELVQPNDPRGVVECKICHTLHHADCWAITGACQVPHLNS